MATTIRLDDELHALIDAERGDVPRQVWCAKALRSAVTGGGAPAATPPGTVARGRQPSVAHAKPARPVAVAGSARPSASPRSHLPRCACAICKPPKKEGKR